MSINVLCPVCFGEGKTADNPIVCGFCSGAGMLQIQCHTDGCKTDAVIIISPGVAPLTVRRAYCTECCMKHFDLNEEALSLL